MLESVSPYLLLRASIPKQNANATPYDLYSLAQLSPTPGAAPDTTTRSISDPLNNANARDGSKNPAAQENGSPSAYANAPAASENRAHEVQAAPLRPAIPARRTHYIADIKTRHSAAAKHTTFTNPSQN